MIQLSENDVKGALQVPETIKIVESAYKDNVAGKIYAGNRIFMPIRGEKATGQWLVANATNQPYFGSKFSSVFPDNIAKGLPSTISTISLYSAETGILAALIDANYLTAVKTGASAAVATNLMAKPDAHALGVIGTGGQALAQVQAIQEVRHLTVLYVFDTDQERMNQFADKVRRIQNHAYDIVTATSADQLVKNVDIISTCTPSRKPVFDGKLLQPGTHVNAIGSFTPEMQEIDSTTVQRADKIITEHVDGLWQAAGDILIPFKQGLFGKDIVTGSVGDALVDTTKRRDNDEQITLYESVGSGVLDIALSIAIYEKLKNS